MFVDGGLKYDSRGGTNTGTAFRYSSTVTLGERRRLSVIFWDGGVVEDFSIISQPFEQPGVVWQGRPAAGP